MKIFENVREEFFRDIFRGCQRNIFTWMPLVKLHYRSNLYKAFATMSMHNFFFMKKIEWNGSQLALTFEKNPWLFHDFSRLIGILWQFQVFQISRPSGHAVQNFYLFLCYYSFRQTMRMKLSPLSVGAGLQCKMTLSGTEFPLPHALLTAVATKTISLSVTKLNSVFSKNYVFDKCKKKYFLCKFIGTIWPLKKKFTTNFCVH